MKHGQIPPSLHFETPNPRIDFAGLHLRVVSDLQPWPVPRGALLRAGVSSFGYGGTNSHVILESVPRSTSLSERLLDMPARTAEPGQVARVVWVFSGQGSQWVGMGRALVVGEPAFRSALERCDRVLRPLLGWSVVDEMLRGAPGAVAERIDVMWPTLFAFQVALAALLRSVGAAPGAVIGHSIGEVAAAHVAGALSLEDAARVIAAQAQLVQRKVGVGMMLLAAVGWEEAQELAVAFEGRVTCAISASPVATVFTGEPGALAQLRDSLAARDVFVRPVNTSAAVHGPQMTFLAEELPALLARISPRPTEIPDGLHHDRRASARGGLRRRLLGLPASRASALRARHDEAARPEATRSSSRFRRILSSSSRSRRAFTTGGSERALPRLPRSFGARTRAPRCVKRWVCATPGARRCTLAQIGSTSCPSPARSRRPGASLPATSPTSLSAPRACHWTTSATRRAFAGRTTAPALWSLPGIRAELLAGLHALAEGREHASVRAGKGPLGSAPKVVFVFPGQGSQWLGMGREPPRQEPAFRERDRRPATRDPARGRLLRGRLESSTPTRRAPGSAHRRGAADAVRHGGGA